MKILLSCFACEPGLGSEEGVGWNMALQTAKYNQTWVLTRTFYRDAIEAEICKNPIPNLHFVYIEPLNWKENFKGRQGGLQLHYYLWQILAYMKARSLHRQIGFDLARHVTYVKFWSPSFISLLPIPFIWGPVGGGEAAPKPFWRDFSLKAKIYEIARDFGQRMGESDPFTRMTARRSVVTFVTTEDTAKRVRQLGAKNVQILSEAGLSKEEIATLAEYPIPTNQPIRLISMGRLLHWKGYHLSVRAFAKANLPDAEYWLLGDGPERPRLQAMIKELGVAARVKLWGRLPRQETLQKLGQSHILVHPSLHDSGGWTCLEGMAAGRPVICLDLGGPATQVTEETGIKVPAMEPEAAVSGLAEAMVRLASDAELRARMGEAGKKRVREFYDWDIKGKFFAQLYEEIAAGK
ncbi:MAG: glycosyltransferase [Oscillatoriaceae bacterium SKW80]|nr:glycosyltransferase [Oscillatoriaceae bacterium SKYG93]MCX8119921.1 glycosyltransferase [Oscillatoriaceae bacterium SKW80]MDW8454079.1 glycosyltransferase [Oscillatoriaceae cyanobacterium SKYGB_i_bin93]HIK29603.1 glycosyltransferase [Oscillatoriaceae cyanobacterium M7585_C2015_266]